MEQQDILTRYKELIIQRNMLKSMLQRLNELTEEDIIISMNYDKPYNDSSSQRCIPANQTQHIAVNYKREFHSLYEKELRECFENLITTDKELLLIEAAIKQLPDHYQKLINLLVIDEVSWDEAAMTLSIARSTITKWRRNAIALIEKYCASINN